QKGPAGFSKITADDWAAKAGTISYEVLTQISARVPRLFKFGSTAL
ncbi:MAG: alanine racemase C-terminal domain-containing protein, partial [Pseudobdellovibrionaceae bacterium]